MTAVPYWQASDVTLHCGDARTIWQHLPEQSAHAIITSPPYYGLRDYGVDGQLGLEESPAEYIEPLADLLTDWGTSVLRADGSLWLNLGDSYSGSWGNYGATATVGSRPKRERLDMAHGTGRPPTSATDFPNKCLLMIPERVALALIERGWIFRNRVVWAKPNGMPSSATDRLATKHEALFHFVRQPRYHYDLDAIREPHRGSSIDRSRYSTSRGLAQARAATTDGGSVEQLHREWTPSSGANPGDVWTIPTVPNPYGHFAMFPPELVRRPILATVPEWACRACGAGRQRIVEASASSWDRRKADGDPMRYGLNGNAAPLSRSLSDPDDRAAGGFGKPAERQTVGWSDCGCDAGWAAGTVADPFAGAGTTAVMARRLGRRSLLVELNADYCQLIARRLAQDVFTFDGTVGS
jgi:DNA modification methylase